MFLGDVVFAAFFSCSFPNLLTTAQREPLSGTHYHPLPVQEVPSLNIPGQGGENRAVRDGRDRFLRFLQQENNDGVS